MENPIWTQTISDIQAQFGTDTKGGLSTENIESLRGNYGFNELPKKGGTSPWKLFANQFSSLMIWLLLAAAIVAGIVGEVVDLYAILAIVILNAALGFFQEYRAEKSLEELQKLATPHSKVIRDGKTLFLPSREIVPGDLLLLEAGDGVPADGRIVDLAALHANEASLTGESLPVEKTAEVIVEGAAVGDQKNMVFMGTDIVRGKAHVIVTSIGLETEIGKIARQLMGQRKEETPLQHKLDTLGKQLVVICLVIVAAVFALGIWRGSSFVDMLLISLSLAVAAIPEGLPAAVTISLSIGVRRMAEKKALIRRLSSVETLGCTNVICSDKTGTLTQNAMTVRVIWVDDTMIEVGGIGYAPVGEFSTETRDLHQVLEIACLCNNAILGQEGQDWVIRGDPTEGALLTAAKKAGLDRENIVSDHPITEENPFDSDRKMMSVLSGDTLFVKGAPDVIVEKSIKQLLNGKEIPIDRDKILKVNEELAKKAYRVLAVAYRTNSSHPHEENLVFAGLFAMIDPPREEVKGAIQLCKQAGIETIMVTGDHKETAIAVAHELGLDIKRAATGHEIENLSDDELRNITVFSRISASHKLRIVQALKDGEKVTAMTGDGVNDAPAVQAADIGISMGITGTDVTKGSSDMIILDDNFATIVQAVKQGRGIYDNIVKFVSYLLSSNIAEILVIFLVMLFAVTVSGSPFVPLLPVQLLWINLVTDGFPAISLAMDPIDQRAMQRPPRPRKEEILNRRFTYFILSISLVVTAGALTACYWGFRSSVELAQTMTFTTLIVLELVRVQMIRKQYQLSLFSNPYLIWALSSSFFLQILVLYIPPLQIVFGTVPLGILDWGVIFGVAISTWWLGVWISSIFDRKPLQN